VTQENERELRKLAQQLRVAIREHLGMAKSSLGAKRKALLDRDPESQEQARLPQPSLG
jgi:hypothetical protein